MKEEKISLKGKVLNVFSANDFEVELIDNKQIIAAHVSGKMRVNKIMILPSDIVDIEMSPYDLTKGRITFRHNTSNNIHTYRKKKR